MNWGEQAVFLEINRRQFNCEKCQKPFSEKLDFVKSRRRYTKRLAAQTIEEVSIDLWKGYKSLATEIIPNAQIVADRFHVMAQINQELD